MNVQLKNRWADAVIFECEQPDSLGPRRARGMTIMAAIAAGSNLSGSDLSGSNLRGSNLRGSNLSGSDLRGSNLSGSNLSGSNLSGSWGIYVPKIEKPHAKILAAIEAGNTFDMRHVHGDEANVCGTTHCRAGWLIHFAGEAGRVLESCIGWEAAGALLSITNCPALDGKVPNFFASNDDALADIRRLAAIETAAS